MYYGFDGWGDGMYDGYNPYFYGDSFYGRYPYRRGGRCGMHGCGFRRRYW